MFKRIMLRFRDMKTVSSLISGAEEQANMSGEEKPGAEHYVLSALNLDDGSARRVFEAAGIDAQQFREALKQQYVEALKQQYVEALSSIGVSSEAIDGTPESIEPNTKLHNSQPSGQALMKSLYAIKQGDKARPLLGAHVIRVAAEMEYGVVARAFRVMGVNREQLVALANNECG